MTAPITCTIRDAGYLHVAITIDAIHPSINSWMGKHWRTRQRMAKEWRSSLHEHVRGHGMFVNPVRIVTTYHFPDARKRDLGNYVPKFAIDGLIGALIPEDDAQNVTACEVRFGPVDRKHPHMVMEVMDARTAGL